MSKKVKISLWIIVSLIVVGGMAVLAIFTFSVRAVSTFREQAADQLNTAVSGEKTDSPVELRRIWFADLINQDYKKVDDLQADYNNLLKAVKNFVAAREAQNALVENFNRGNNGDKPLGGDLLRSVDQYLATMKKRFPNETERIAALENLLTKVSSNTDFDAVSSDIDQIVHNNDVWLNDLRTELNQQIDEFQAKVNK